MRNAYAVLDGQFEFCFLKMSESEIRNLKLKTINEKKKKNSFQTQACAHVYFTLFSFNVRCTVSGEFNSPFQFDVICTKIPNFLLFKL